MSIPVDLDALRDELAARERPAYLVTAGDDGPPHMVATFLRWADGAFETGCGNTTAGNLAQRPGASVVVPPDEPGDYSLIFDATGEVIEGPTRTVRLTPTRAVLHRPAGSPDDGVPAATTARRSALSPTDRPPTDRAARHTGRRQGPDTTTT